MTAGLQNEGGHEGCQGLRSDESRLYTHPLDPLVPQEFEEAIDILKRDKLLTDKVRFVECDLKEPTPDVVDEFESGGSWPPREVYIVVVLESAQLVEAVVCLTLRHVLSWSPRESPGQPSILPEEFLMTEEAVKKSALFAEVLKKRGISTPELVEVDPWSVGKYNLDYEEKAPRLAMAMCFLKSHDGDRNGYAHPIDGVVPIVDLATMEVIHVDDHPGAPVPPEDCPYEKPFGETPFRQDLKPLLVLQPEGPSFTVEGRLVKWQKWSVRVGWSAREGLILHQLKYFDKDRYRPVMHRAAANEMVVPYGDPRPYHFRKNAFDIGDYGLGRVATSLSLGCDCLGHIHYFDAHMTDTRGRPYVVKNAICVHEEDYGVLWKHVDWHDNYNQVRRSRRLVISIFVTVANYDYGFFWYLYQDGTIQVENKLTGIMNTAAEPVGELYHKHGTIIAPGLYAPVHQHFINYRLHMAVDGRGNSVYEMNTEACPPGPENPHLNAFYTKSTLLTREQEAQRVVNPQSGRCWRIVNHKSLNRLGQPVAFKLMPGENILPFAQPESSVMKRAVFAQKHVWVTPYSEPEKFAAGQFPNQHPGGDGLPHWTAQDRGLVDQDLVLWYTLGVLHNTRSEDWPVMPCAYAGFALKPFNFFDRNPALDVPPQSIVNGTFTGEPQLNGTASSHSSSASCGHSQH